MLPTTHAQDIGFFYKSIYEMMGPDASPCLPSSDRVMSKKRKQEIKRLKGRSSELEQDIERELDFGQQLYLYADSTMCNAACSMY